jgi:outer membrane receptor protein involved in Fe transport
MTPWDSELSVTWRHYGEVDRAAATCSVIGCTQDATLGGLPRLDATWEAVEYFDIAGSIGLPLNSRLRLGLNNVFDKDPPIGIVGAGLSGNGNTFPQTYEARGRWVFMGITVDM